jgi:hypothetical protein
MHWGVVRADSAMADGMSLRWKSVLSDPRSRFSKKRFASSLGYLGFQNPGRITVTAHQLQELE